MKARSLGCLIALLILLHLPISATLAQSSSQPAARPWSANVVFPQAYHAGSIRYNVQVTSVSAEVSIVEQIATTTLSIELANRTSSDQTAELVVPVPDGAVVKGFTFEGTADEPRTELLTKDDARRTFDSIVAKLKDPALLEFAGFNLVRSSVFPVPKNGTQKLQITYEHLLSADGDRIDYVLPRSGSVTYNTPWKINITIESQRKITTVFSPTHALTTGNHNRKKVTASVADSASANPGAFSLSYLLQNGAVSASMFAYPDADKKGGYFLLLAGTADQRAETQIKTAKNRDRQLREITLVIDRSGSMRGEKLEQAKEAARQVIAGLKPGERFNILSYSDDVSTFSEHSLEKSKESILEANKFIDAIISRGGTNIHAALTRALQNKPQTALQTEATSNLPITLFLTDGIPTVGKKSEAEIRDVAIQNNPFHHRVFTFGVGFDVNTPLLDKIATTTRGFSTFVLPSENVEVKVAEVFKGLDGPALSYPKLRVVNRNNKATPNRVSNLLPNAIPDLYEGDQLVLLGRYKGQRPLRFELSGQYHGKDRKFTFEFNVRKSAKIDNSFVARLWASRRIAKLTDNIRDLGATTAASTFARTFGNISGTARPAATLTSSTKQPAALEAQIHEMVDEIISLSTEFGILTEYTSFLAEEGVDLSDKQALEKRVTANYLDRAVGCRTGIASVNQEINNSAQRSQSLLNVGNSYWTSEMKLATITNVQQCNSGAFYRRGKRWISNELIDEDNMKKPDQTIKFGSPEFLELVHELRTLERQQEVSLEGDVLLKLDGKTILVTKGEK